MRKRQNILHFLWFLGLSAGLLVLSQFFFFRLDFTADKRYSISPATKATLKQLEDVVMVKVYLDGELPSGFRRFRSSIEETLEEFQAYGHANIQYEFIDPDLISDKKEKDEFLIGMAQRGIQPTNIHVKEEGQKIEKLIFPGAIVSYKGKEVPVMLLKGNSATDPNEILNQSAENVEYELVSAIKKLTRGAKKRIAILSGHGEPDNIRFADLAAALKESYEVKRLDVSKAEQILTYDAILLDQPTLPFSEADLLKIDQFLMRGGTGIFLIDPIRIKLDSMGANGSFIFPYDLNLDDLLFKYGVRINKDLLQDIYCAQIPMTVGNLGDKPQIQLVPWTYFPVLNNYAKHPITKSLDALQAKFISSLDTVKAEGIRKTPLLSTSEYTKLSPVLGNVDLNQMRNDPNPALYKGGVKTIAYLLEGSFKSPFASRPIAKPTGYLGVGKPTSIIVMSDGDVALNDVNPKNGQPMPLGYDPYMRRNYSNKDFIVNGFHYLLDEDGLITTKNKEISLRPLDKGKIRDGKTRYQLMNVLLPPMLVLLAWWGLALRRRKKFQRSFNN
jgi:gliding-associated putative ABC transporter substrate-binding component GldG